ncbi:unnamed protein product [Rotaria sp. Silwood1]|nr:unnamed protein product [Rotaria sp. Silwood1]
MSQGRSNIPMESCETVKSGIIALSTRLIQETIEKALKPQQAIFWLTNDTALIRFVNKALREQDIYILFVLRFLLVDIHNKLIQYQADSLNTFHIQPMMKSQIESILAYSSQLLVFSGFLFASTNKPRIISNMNNNDQFETVLIDFKEKYRSDVAPFAFLRDINSNINKQMNQDQEVIFMCGLIFQVGSSLFKNCIWTLELSLSSDGDVQLLLTMTQQLKRSHNLCTISDLLIHCKKKTDKAIIYYQCLLNKLLEKHVLMSQINKELVKIMPAVNSDK